MYKEPLFRLIAQQVGFAKQTNADARHENVLESLMKHMPSGSGIDAGTKLLLEESNNTKLVFLVEYHHMNQNGYYCGWSSRKIVITPSLTSPYSMEFIDEDASGADLTEVGEETSEEYDNSEFTLDSTNDYLADTFRQALETEYELTMADFEPTKLTIHGELVR